MTVKAGAWAAGVCVLAAAIGTGLYWKYGGGGNKGGWAMAPAKVAVAPAVQADFPVSLSGIGSLEATRQVQVPAEVDGRVAQILFNPGESARAGQLLVQLNDAPEQGRAGPAAGAGEERPCAAGPQPPAAAPAGGDPRAAGPGPGRL